jgi:hypothetical protein
MGFLQTGYGMAIWIPIITSSENRYTAKVRSSQIDQLVRKTDDEMPK